MANQLRVANRAGPTRVVLRAYAFAVYGLAGIVTPYMMLFAGGWWVAKSVDSGHQGSIVSALWVDGGLLLLFALQHSVMARRGVKDRLGLYLPASVERSTYVLATCAALILLFVFWRPIDIVFWKLTGSWEPAIECVYWFGFALVYIATLWIDHFELLGLRQAFRNRREGPQRLCTSGPYRSVRHPIMAGLFIVFWATPVMTVGHLLFSSVMSAYIVVGTGLEEQEMLKKFGRLYVAYQRQALWILPSSTQPSRHEGCVPRMEAETGGRAPSGNGS